MEDQTFVERINEELKERLSLITERLEEIAENPGLRPPYASFFREAANALLLQHSVFRMAQTQELSKLTIEQAQKQNRALYPDEDLKHYECSFANPAYAAEQMGGELGPLLSAVFVKIQSRIPYVFAGNSQYLCIFSELLVELYNCMEDEDSKTPAVLKERIASFMHDNTEVFHRDQLAELFFPEYDRNIRILMEADLTTPAYLYRYGKFVGENETKSAAYFNSLSEEKIRKMAATYTEGYRLGFETTGKDLRIKTTVELRYPLGFERMVREAVRNFEKMGLQPVLKPYSTPLNRQYEYDHKEDAALWLDKSYVERSLEVYHTVFEEYQAQAAGYAGPAVIEVFGETPFSPVQKPENLRYSKQQQPLAVEHTSRFSQMMNRYIHGEERSFTIIAYPIPAIGAQYEEIFEETVKINTLDYMLYRKMQQKLIDVLDTAEYVHIQGTNGNRTDLMVRIYPLSDPQKETAFENCVADVNIPVGEVFTTPVLSGTNGKLHVRQVYLNGLDYRDLELDFTDGMITRYTCANFLEEEKNQNYIRDNVLMHHETLPLGEFAIGTNTTAYCMARRFRIADKLPILIAEKTGPHFAVGDTCYTYDEDHMTYNPDGKAIVARDNERSILRKSDPDKAYYNCHTDITIPYDELGKITVIQKDAVEINILENGRFTVPGTEELNKPLEEEEKWHRLEL